MRRRTFVSLTVHATCVGSLAACGDPGGPGGLDEDVVVDIADHDGLDRVGGWVRLPSDDTGYSEAIFLERIADDEFIALSAYCNHQGCNVERDGTAYACPCHGSRFAANGDLRSGPASADLRRFETDFDADAGTVTLLA